MHKSAPRSRTRCIAGFSMVELAISMCILLMLTGIAVPSLTHSLRTYQLNDTAGRVSDMLKFTRFEAVRRNKQINCQIKKSGSDWQVWADSDLDGNLDSTEKQMLITGFVTLLPGGGSPGPPAPTAISAALGGTALTTLSGSAGSVTFDARGAIRAGIGGTISNLVYVFYVGAAANPDEFGYRAVVLLPSGATQIWTAPAGGTWQRIG